MERKISAQQKHGVIVCLPKSSDPTTPADFRPITLLNTDCKIMARIIAYQLCPQDEGAITSEPILRGAGEDHFRGYGNRA